MNAAQLFVKCPENEGVEYIFGVLGEENLEVMDALIDSSIRFIATRHEQGAAFMAACRGVPFYPGSGRYQPGNRCG